MIVLDWERDQLRYQYFIKDSNQHQAKMELRTYKWLVEKYTKPGDTILDPMSGIGTVHFASFMGRHTIAIELVPAFVQLQHRNLANMLELWENNLFYTEFDEWDYQAEVPENQLLSGLGTVQVFEGDCRRFLPLQTIGGGTYDLPIIDAVIFSPPYGNLWAFNASNRESKIMQEKNYQVGYDDSAANVGNYANYVQYLTAMKIIYGKCVESLKPGGILVTVVKDYIQDGKRVLCSKDNMKACMEVGLIPVDWHFRKVGVNNPFSVKSKRERIAAGKHNPSLDIDTEDIIVLRKAL